MKKVIISWDNQQDFIKKETDALKGELTSYEVVQDVPKLRDRVKVQIKNGNVEFQQMDNEYLLGMSREETISIINCVKAYYDGVTREAHSTSFDIPEFFDYKHRAMGSDCSVCGGTINVTTYVFGIIKMNLCNMCSERIPSLLNSIRSFRSGDQSKELERVNIKSSKGCGCR